MQQLIEKRRLVGALDCINEVFPTERRPCLRTFRKWQHQGFIPYRQIGRRHFFDPEEVRAAIDKEFWVQQAKATT
jgi:hypothetical protein